MVENLKIRQFQIPLGAVVDVNTGLKATTPTVILLLEGIGRLLAIYATDPDNLAQNETIRIVVDDLNLINTTVDIPNTDFWLHILESIAKQGWEGNATVTNVLSNTPIHFSRSLLVYYSRAAAGTTGLTINIVYDIEHDIITS